MRNTIKGLAASLALVTMSLAPQLAAAQATCKLNGKVVPCDQLGDLAGLGIGVTIAVGLLFLALGIFWLMMIIHAATHDIENKAMWIIVMVFAGILGALLYYFLVKRKFVASSPAAPSAPQQAPPAPPQA